MGVLRITSALASSPSRGEERADAHVDGSLGAHRKPIPLNEGVYRLG